MQGWECPVCYIGISPYLNVCPECKKRPIPTEVRSTADYIIPPSVDVEWELVRSSWELIPDTTEITIPTTESEFILLNTAED